ncbi:MAG: ATP-binding protein, partial [Clostridia bacterium]|nr:ATP-binding protein [Clostridia bacterium]
MGYNKKAYIQTKEIFKAREDRARNDAFMRKCEVEAAIPEVKQINNALASTGAEIAIELAKGSHNIEERINALRDKNLALQEKRAQLLVANGYPADYTKPKFKCEKCQDSGYVGTKLCECFHREVVENTIRNSGIGALVDRQSFDNFDLKYYSADPGTLSEMKYNLEILREYAEGFTTNRSSVIMMGATGLGKTHMSTAIAKVVIEKGYDVVYETVQNIMSDFEYERFGRGYNTDAEEKKTDKYFNCDLLIMDDLGTELT